MELLYFPLETCGVVHSCDHLTSEPSEGPSMEDISNNLFLIFCIHVSRYSNIFFSYTPQGSEHLSLEITSVESECIRKKG